MKTYLKSESTRVNFINVLTHSFYTRRSQKRKKLLELTVFFVLLGSACVKAAHKMLVKLTAGLKKQFLQISFSFKKRDPLETRRIFNLDIDETRFFSTTPLQRSNFIRTVLFNLGTEMLYKTFLRAFITNFKY